MDEADDTQQSSIDNYTGVAIKVCPRLLGRLSSVAEWSSGVVQLQS